MIRGPKYIFAALAVVAFTALIPAFIAKANSLDAIYFLLSRMEANIDGATETVEYIVAVAPNQTFASAGTVTIEFPDADDGLWCRTAGTLVITGVTSSSADLTGTNWEIDAVLPNSGAALTATCAQGVGASSVDKITVANVGALTAGTTYGIKLTNGAAAGVIGTDDTAGSHTTNVILNSGSVNDSSTFDIELVSSDTVTVTATVEAVPTISCSISTNTVDIGSLFPGGAYGTASHTITTTTSASTNGYYWTAYGTGDGATDAGLYKSTATTYLLDSTGSTTIDLTGVGAEGFGMTVSDPDAAGAAVVPADFGDGTAGTFGALDLLGVGAGARMILYQNTAQTSPDNSTVTYGGRAGTAAEAGSYSEEVKFVCGAYY